MNASTFFVTGGTLRADAECYVARRADEELYAALSRGELSYVLTARQMGKSSLMVRTAQRLRAAGVRTAVLDLTALGQNLSIEQWYRGLLLRLGRQLGLEDVLEQWWEAHGGASPLERWTAGVEELVLAAPTERQGSGPRPIVIFIDEIDVVRPLPFSTDDFFAGLRAWHNRRAVDPGLEQLTFCLLGVASPSSLIQDPRLTPFNIGRRIELADFTATELLALAAGFRDPSLAPRLLERVHHWTHGHPYLSQRLAAAVADLETAGAADVDRACRELFLSSRALERDDNLLFVRDRLLRADRDPAALLIRYRAVRRGRRVADDAADPLCETLRLSGVARVEDGRLVVRNRIYAQVFDLAWVRACMPGEELRRQRRAFSRGAAFTMLVVVVALGASWIRGAERAALQAEALYGYEWMTFVPAGPFTAGTGGAAHTETLDDFWIDSYEVSRGSFQLCVLDGRCAGSGDTPGPSVGALVPGMSLHADSAMTFVTWDEAASYCEWVGKRLPTNLEWEKAARGPDGRRFPWGSRPPVEIEGPENPYWTPPYCTVAKLQGCPRNRSLDISQGTFFWDTAYPGLVAIVGNAAEWVADVQPGDPADDTRTLRGGSFQTDPKALSEIPTVRLPGRSRAAFAGFRCASSDIPRTYRHLSPPDGFPRLDWRPSSWVSVADHLREQRSDTVAWDEARMRVLEELRQRDPAAGLSAILLTAFGRAPFPSRGDAPPRAVAFDFQVTSPPGGACWEGHGDGAYTPLLLPAGRAELLFRSRAHPELLGRSSSTDREGAIYVEAGLVHTARTYVTEASKPTRGEAPIWRTTCSPLDTAAETGTLVLTRPPRTAHDDDTRSERNGERHPARASHARCAGGLGSGAHEVIAVDPTGAFVVAVEEDGAAELLDTTTGLRTAWLDLPTADRGTITSAGVSDGAGVIVAATSSGALLRWRADGTLAWSQRSSKAAAKSVAVSADGRRIAVGIWNRVDLIEPNERRLWTKWTGLTDPIRELAISRDGADVAAHDGSRVALLGSSKVDEWRLPSGELDHIDHLAFVRDGSALIVAGTQSGTVTVLRSSRELGVAGTVHLRAPVEALSIGPNDTVFALSAGTVIAMDGDLHFLRSWTPEGTVRDLAAAPDVECLVLSGVDGIATEDTSDLTSSQPPGTPARPTPDA